MSWRVVPMLLAVFSVVGMPLRLWHRGGLTPLARLRSVNVQVLEGRWSVPVLPDPSSAWLAEAPGDGTQHVVLGPMRIDRSPRGLTVANDRPEASILAAVRVASGWVFVSDDGVVTRAENFTGQLMVLGTLPCGFRVPGGSRGRMVAQDDRGTWWSTEGVEPPRALALPWPALAVGFVDEGHGMAALEGGALVRSTDGGATWTAVTGVTGAAAYNVTPTVRGMFSVATSSGTVTLTVDGTVTADADTGLSAEEEAPLRSELETVSRAAHRGTAVVQGGRCEPARVETAPGSMVHARAEMVCVEERVAGAVARRGTGDMRVSQSVTREEDMDGPTEHLTVTLPDGTRVLGEHGFPVDPRNEGWARSSAFHRGEPLTFDQVRLESPGGATRGERAVEQSVPVAIQGVALYRGRWGLVVGAPWDPAVPRFHPVVGADGGDAERTPVVDLPRFPEGAIAVCNGPTSPEATVLVQRLPWIVLSDGSIHPRGDGAFGRDVVARVEFTADRACVRQVWGRLGSQTFSALATADGVLEGVVAPPDAANAPTTLVGRGHAVRCRSSVP